FLRPHARRARGTGARGTHMRATAAMIEQAEAAVEAEAANAISGARLAVARPGRTVCVDCERPIAEARLKAAPFACRCLVCQETFERHARGL
ncbi:MAG: TraR/DksA C4-type zinc finger protein, partial [Rhizobiaceae bacterium]